MVLSHPFHCPSRVVEGEAFGTLATILAGRRFSLVTSAGWIERGVQERLGRAGLKPLAILSDVPSNPAVGAVKRLAAQVPDCDVVVALGGGSVIDASKGVLALKGLAQDHDAFDAHLKSGVALPAGMKVPQLIAVPTTAGTGSEVTRWGTLWGEDGSKYSVQHPALYPTHAVLDPNLLLSMPRDLRLATGLDAVSHAMEAVWNRRHSAVTDALAHAAIKTLFQHLKGALAENAPVALLARIQTAALLAGLAMGTTQTALAHSISYPFTARFGLPHGFACSFTLAEVARYNMSGDPQRLSPIASALDCELGRLPEAIENWFAQLGLAYHVGRFVTVEAIAAFGDELITPARAANNIRDVDAAAAKAIAGAALAKLVARAA